VGRAHFVNGENVSFFLGFMSFSLFPQSGHNSSQITFVPPPSLWCPCHFPIILFDHPCSFMAFFPSLCTHTYNSQFSPDFFPPGPPCVSVESVPQSPLSLARLAPWPGFFSPREKVNSKNTPRQGRFLASLKGFSPKQIFSRAAQHCLAKVGFFPPQFYRNPRWSLFVSFLLFSPTQTEHGGGTPRILPLTTLGSADFKHSLCVVFP